MPIESDESLGKYLARLEETRVNLVKEIDRQPQVFPFELSVEPNRAIGLAELAKVSAELRAIESTRLFRFRSRLVGLRNRYKRETKSLGAETSKSVQGLGHFADYDRWVNEVDKISPFEEAVIGAAIEMMIMKPLIGIAVSVEGRELTLARQFATALRAQHYDAYWLTVTIVGEAKQAELQELKAAIGDNGEVAQAKDMVSGLNSAIELQKAEWVLAMRDLATLPEHALFAFADAAVKSPGAQLIYSDEDSQDAHGRRCQPNFKTDWNELLLLGSDYLGSSVLFRRSRLQQLGGFRVGFGSAILWEMCLRYTEGLSSGEIIHLPFILLHHLKTTEPTEGPKAVQEALDRRQIPGRVIQGDFPGTNRVKLLPDVMPHVSVVIPTRNRVELLQACVESIDRITDYPSYEYIIVDNGSDEPETLNYLEHLVKRSDVKVVKDSSPFNYSALNNFGAYHASGEVLALINNDLEVVDPDWMMQLTAYAMRPETGIVGARLLYPDQTIQHAGVVIGLFDDFAQHAFRLDGKANGCYQNRAVLDQWITAVTGACMFVRAEVYEKLGGLDEKTLPIEYNDIDLCLKSLHAGYRNVYAGSVVCIHHESKSRGGNDTPEKAEASQRALAAIVTRWGAGYTDRHYNPNLSLWPSSYRLSFLPRVHKPWYV